MNRDTRNGMAKTILVFLCMCSLVLLSSLAFAQETTGGIQGTVKDPQGAVIGGATVAVTGPALIGKSTATTDSAGNFRIAQLPPGSYDLTVSASGFSTTKQSLNITVGALPSITVTMKLGQASETVEVNVEGNSVDVTQSKVQSNVTRQILDSIPKGRSFQSVIPFAPGARQEPMQGARGDRTNGFQIDGATDSENVYLIDGINTTNIQNGGVGKNFQTDFIQEVQVKSSSFEAEFGGALGGVINAIPKRGSNTWHGEVKTYLQFSALDASDPCAGGYTANLAGSLVCGQRLKPGTVLNTTARTDGTLEYFVPKKDDRHTIEPGFEIGGPIWKEKLWLFSSYIPSYDVTRRDINYTNATAPGPRQLTGTSTQHNAYNRLDYAPFSRLRMFASWNYAYVRQQGLLYCGTSACGPDSAYGQVNTGAGTNPNTLRPDSGTLQPLAVWGFGGDWTPTSKLSVSVRYGYFFQNTKTLGVPSGIRYLYDTQLGPTTKDIQGNRFDNVAGAVPGTPGFSNFGSSNFSTAFDAYKRRSWNADASYFVGNMWGSHTFKFGYFWAGQDNTVLKTFNTAQVNIDWGVSYQPKTSTGACDAIKAQNLATYGQSVCQGKYGYFFTGGTTTSNSGGSAQTAQALYVQDSWTVGHGLTLNLGIRFDQETQPPYDPLRFPAVEFGWGQKIAPRIGGAYDLFHNGKVKIYASYGKFFDIMKMGLARGSFGSDYWHECVYALDSLDPSAITPAGGVTAPGGCPPSGAATGVGVGRFIENVDFRATKTDSRDPAIQPNMKPMEQHEFVTGVDWAISPNWSLETRYSRKRLDNTIEDMAITDDLGFYIGNPGSTFSDLLHRKVSLLQDPAVPLVGPLCAECPATVAAIRRYDGLEFRLAKRPTGKWFGAVSYTYSRLTGNYSGLTDTDATDGNGGRHSPNNHRAFDIPTMTYLPSGKIDDGPLSTDRPHTAKMYGYYRLNWLGHVTSLGAIQSAFQGSPISSCIPVVGSSSACQWAEGRGNFVKFHSDPTTGDFVKDGVEMNARTSPYFQTDLVLTQEFKVSKQHENYRLIAEANAYNLFNQHAPVAYYEFVTPTNEVNPSRASRGIAGDPNVDWGKVMNGYNYVDALNGKGAFAGVQDPLTYAAARYGTPQVFQTARQFRFALKFVF